MIRRWFVWWHVSLVPDDGMWAVMIIPHDHEKRVLLCWIDGLDEKI